MHYYWHDKEVEAVHLSHLPKFTQNRTVIPQLTLSYGPARLPGCDGGDKVLFGQALETEETIGLSDISWRKSWPVVTGFIKPFPVSATIMQ